MRNKDIVLAWIHGRAARTKSFSFTTDGKFLRSYNLVIGYTNDLGQVFVLDYTSPDNFQSQTTSTHVGLAKRAVHESNIIDPREYTNV
jgi:hypothetical protein